MGRDLVAGLVDPSFKASSFSSSINGVRSSITFLDHLLLLWFLDRVKLLAPSDPIAFHALKDITTKPNSDLVNQFD